MICYHHQVAGVKIGVKATRGIRYKQFLYAHQLHYAHRENQLIMKWMTIDYVRELVQRVDIGGSYPRHVQSMIDRSASRAEHISAFAIRWRITLMFDAARARAVKRLDKFAYGAAQSTLLFAILAVFVSLYIWLGRVDLSGETHK